MHASRMRTQAVTKINDNENCFRFFLNVKAQQEQHQHAANIRYLKLKQKEITKGIQTCVVSCTIHTNTHKECIPRACNIAQHIACN